MEGNMFLPIEEDQVMDIERMQRGLDQNNKLHGQNNKWLSGILRFILVPNVCLPIFISGIGIIQGR